MAFQKGKSGNPGGRPKEDHEVKELARKHTAEAIKRLAHWMRSDDPRASVPAAMALLDRGHGKPNSSVELTGKDGAPLFDIGKLSDEQLAALEGIVVSAGQATAARGDTRGEEVSEPPGQLH